MSSVIVLEYAVQRIVSKEQDRVLLFLLFFLYVNVFLTKAEGEKRDATHTGGSVNRLLAVTDEQANVRQRCTKSKKKMRRVYIDVKHAKNIRTVVWQCCKLNCVEQLPPIRLVIEKAGTQTHLQLLFLT
jgi:hypothetical protein